MSLSKFLIFGANGSVGKNLVKSLEAARIDYIAYSHAPTCEQEKYDFTSTHPRILELVPGQKYVACICAGYTNIDACAENRELSDRINVTAPIELLDYLRGYDVLPVFFSSDAVFGGRNEPYTEFDTPSPLNIYGRQKVRVENHLKKKFTDFVLLRMSKIYSTEPDNALMKQALMLRNGLAIDCFSDQISAPVYLDDVAKFILHIIGQDGRGVFHLAQQEAMSRYEQGICLARALGVSEKMVRNVTLAGAKLQEPRARHVVLAATQAKKSGFVFTSFADMVIKVSSAR